MQTAFFATIYFLWFLSELLLNRIFKSGKTDRKNLDRNSLIWIWIIIIVSVSSARVLSSYFYLPISSGFTIRYAGLAIMLAGMIIRGAAVFQLGKYFTVDVTIKQDHRIIKTGLYKYVRHPSYSGSLITFIGYALTLNNWLSLVVVIVPVFLSFMQRIKIEEKVLTDQFGSEYLNYKKETKYLVPRVY